MATPEMIYPHRRDARPGTYCEAIGRCGAFLGDESGTFEAWLWPVRVLTDLRVFCAAAGERVVAPEVLSPQWLEFRRDGLVLTYSLPQTTLRQILRVDDDLEGLVCVLEVDSSIPVLCGLQFQADLVPMWPASLGGRYSLWDGERGAYVLTEGRRKCAALVGAPGAMKLSELVAHEPPGAPLALALECPEGGNSRVCFVIVLSLTGVDHAKGKFDRLVSKIDSELPRVALTEEVTEPKANETLRLRGALGPELAAATAALERGLVRNPELGEALVAGFGMAGDSYRPGFAWFFGGDAAINSLALNPLGLREPVKLSLEFFARYQREDGRVAHEISQAANWIDWFGEYPYAFIHADTTPYFILSAANYLRWSGDVGFVRKLWPSVVRAFEYCVSLDTDGDGLMENSAAGLGALELGSLLVDIHVDIYLASVWTAALRELAWMAAVLGDSMVATRASDLYQSARESLNRIFWDDRNERFEFALLSSGKLLTEPTAWSAMPLTFRVDNRPVEGTLRLLASADLCADWGVRMVGCSSTHYDPVGYNNGAVWPFLTGLVAQALVRAHNAEAARFLLRAVGQIHFDFAYGFAHEVFSGDFYRPLPASVPHQLFSSSTFAAALLLGMLGLSASVPDGDLGIEPHLPPGPAEFTLERVPWGTTGLRIAFRKEAKHLRVILENVPPDLRRIRFGPAIPAGATLREVRVVGNSVRAEVQDFGRDQHVLFEAIPNGTSTLEVEIEWTGGVELELPWHKPLIGDRSQGLRLLDAGIDRRRRRLWLLTEGPGGASRELILHTGWTINRVEGAVLERLDAGRYRVRLHFPGETTLKYVRKKFEFEIQDL